jgi:hypothetical protein
MATSYGTIPNGTSQQAHNGLLDPTDEERASLLNKDDRRTIFVRARQYMNVNITKTWGDVVLLGCYIITGLLDSSSVQVWGSFVSMQTGSPTPTSPSSILPLTHFAGNTVYLGLGLAAPYESTRWIRSGISLGCFCLGSTFFAAYHRYFGGRKRWVMVSSFVIQLLLMLGAALIVSLGPETGSQGPVTRWIAIPLALIAFQSAGQAVTSRVLQYGGLTSVVLTSIYCDLFSDPKLLTSGFRENPERNRRAAAPVLLLIGAILGGLWAHSSVGLAGALWTAVGLKAAATLAWVLWVAEPEARQL